VKRKQLLAMLVLATLLAVWLLIKIAA